MFKLWHSAEITVTRHVRNPGLDTQSDILIKDVPPDRERPLLELIEDMLNCRASYVTSECDCDHQLDNTSTNVIV